MLPRNLADLITGTSLAEISAAGRCANHMQLSSACPNKDHIKVNVCLEMSTSYCLDSSMQKLLLHNLSLHQHPCSNLGLQPDMLVPEFAPGQLY